MQLRPIFITGIGTGIGKTVVSAIITEALEADYWKPVQAGNDATDTDWVRAHLTNSISKTHRESFLLKTPASPHYSAQLENIAITVQRICSGIPFYSRNLIVEGAGGVMVPLNNAEFVLDLIQKLNARVVLVSRNYLGSLNHSLLTAALCKQMNLDVAGWIFNGYDSLYEEQICSWTGFPRIGSIPYVDDPGKSFIKAMADLLRESITKALC
ncbi:MAG: dethiobiotin synthase [Chitinophagaceae bacterium]|nr:dethiobiotin synthase [Chitinophagaceae bacterium]